MRNIAKAITSSSQEKLIGDYLKYFGSKNNLCYYVMYYLIIETGIKFKQATCLKVNDVKNKNSIDVSFNCTDGYRTVLLSDTMMQRLNELTENKSPDAWLFASSDSGEPITPIAFQNALNSIRKRLKISEPLNITTLRKTYYFHCYQYKLQHGAYKDDDIGYISIHNDEWVEEYLGLKEPSADKVRTTRNRIQFNTPALLEREAQLTRQTLFEDNYGQKIIHHSLTLINQLSALLDNPHITDYDCSRLLTKIFKLETIIRTLEEEE